MGNEEIHQYYCQSCEEEIGIVGTKSTCPYCKAKSPVFDLLRNNSWQQRTRSSKHHSPWYKQIFKRG